MPAKNVRRKGTRSGQRKDEREGPKDSATWEEHGERMRLALGIGTGLFMKANAERIQNSSSEVAAKNSYMSGMIDMLTVARAVLGFWGADQILLELERLNMKRAPDACGPDAPGSASAMPGAAGAKGVDVGGSKRVPAPQGLSQKAMNGTRRDPMFA